MRITRRADVDDIDVFAREHLLPAGRRLFEPEARLGLFHLRFGTPHDDLEHRLEGDVLEKARDLAPGVGMRPPHEVVTDHRNVQFTFGHGRLR